MTISPACRSDLGDAFRLLYGPGTEDLSSRLERAHRMVACGELNPDNVLVALRDGALLGAVFCQALPGSIAIIWPPRAVGEDPVVEDALMAAGLRMVAGVKVVQAFLSPKEAGRAGPLLRAGFQRAARVWQMRRAVRPPLGPNSVPAGIQLVPYAECNRAEFLEVLVRAHDDSLDCPELHGLRTPEEVFAGYRDCAPDFAGWWLARDSAEPVGVLILASAELAFVGVVPTRRGRGIGRMLVAAANSATSVAVDSRNAPAVQLYRSVGFEVASAQDVYFVAPPASAGATRLASIPI